MAHISHYISLYLNEKLSYPKMTTSQVTRLNNDHCNLYGRSQYLILMPHKLLSRLSGKYQKQKYQTDTN